MHKPKILTLEIFLNSENVDPSKKSLIVLSNNSSNGIPKLPKIVVRNHTISKILMQHL